MKSVFVLVALCASVAAFQPATKAFSKPAFAMRMKDAGADAPLDWTPSTVNAAKGTPATPTVSGSDGDSNADAPLDWTPSRGIPVAV
jgi:hypothetical protein